MSVLKSPAAKAMIAFVVVMLALLVALWPRTGDALSGDPAQNPTRGVTDEPATAEMLATARADAALAPCPDSTLPVPDGAALRGVLGECLADGQPVDLGAVTAGTPTVINFWAVWCEPCRRELPLFDELSTAAGDRLDVIAVHANEGAAKPFAILTFLAEVGVHLPVVGDVDGTIAKALKAPRVFPSTVLIRADGTVAAVLPTLFTSYEQLTGVIDEKLGVRLDGSV